ncbi:MAG: hypothetical protein D6744_12975 [Planctomycetota bacterium]|nr:MAG: hypothetical protein D6744_12975 [Planctomycetota bacterium]
MHKERTAAGPARDAVEDVCAGFHAPGSALPASLEPIEPQRLPAVYQTLLVHQRHMTSTLSAHVGAPVRLSVLRHFSAADVYAREIVLTAPSGRVVEYGIARIRLACVPSPAREEILARDKPLGDILIEHDVLRTISPRWFLRARSVEPLSRVISQDVCDAFGRIGAIELSGAPAVELLEVVINASEQPANESARMSE